MLDIFAVPKGFAVHKTSDDLEPIAGVDLKEFHDMDFVFNHLNNSCLLNVSYFSDEIIKTDEIFLLKRIIETSVLDSQTKTKWDEIARFALNNNKWLFFVAD